MCIVYQQPGIYSYVNNDFIVINSLHDSLQMAFSSNSNI